MHHRIREGNQERVPDLQPAVVQRVPRENRCAQLTACACPESQSVPCVPLPLLQKQVCIQHQTVSPQNDGWFARVHHCVNNIDGGEHSYPRVVLVVEETTADGQAGNQRARRRVHALQKRRQGHNGKDVLSHGKRSSIYTNICILSIYY
jgi:hypothetical protein